MLAEGEAPIRAERPAGGSGFSGGSRPPMGGGRNFGGDRGGRPAGRSGGGRPGFSKFRDTR